MGRQRQQAEVPSAVLSDGTTAQVIASPYVSGYELMVGETPQSHVDLADPTHLHFEYIARMGAVIDVFRDRGEAISAVHLGGGALTVPRYIAATRPGSRQQVIELEQPLWNLVRENLPLARDAQVRVRIGDARAGLSRLPASMTGDVDLLVSDVYSGARTPAHLTSVEFYREAAALLRSDGLLLVNVADAPGLAFARSQLATIRSVLPNVAVLAEAQVLKGRRFGNLVMAASATALPTEWLPRLLAAGPHPAQLLAGADARAFARGSAIVTDADAVASPAPSTSLFER